MGTPQLRKIHRRCGDAPWHERCAGSEEKEKRKMTHRKTVTLGALLQVLLAVPMAQAGGMPGLLGLRTDMRADHMDVARDERDIVGDQARMTRDEREASPVDAYIGRDAAKLAEEGKAVEHAEDRDLHKDEQ